MSYRIVVDGEVCISSGRCVAERPDVFRFDAEEVAEIVPGAPSPPDEQALELARACPSGAVQLVDADTGEEIDVF
ncbi:ferredoxin [Actinomycetospora sp. CA-084318]|uniref:ferredoxin n=1 Tax=Actinomycetospora sp. CA-084318 TaxID=3239892 RepID=UPI003D988902